MVTISLCMIVKNEEKTLGRCLESVRDIPDEMIIVDTGSTDQTKMIAARYQAKVYDFAWIDDFAAARNFSFAQATQDYILWLDADDVLLKDDENKLRQLKETLNPQVDIVMMRYNLGVDDKGNAVCTFFRERLLKRSMNYTWQDPIHEYIKIEGNIINSDICVTHKKVERKTARNLEIFEKIISEGRILSDRNCFYYARELYINSRIDEAIQYYDKFLDTEGGLLSNYIDASIDMSNCYLSKNDRINALKALLRSMEHDLPRAEVCCQIGHLYKTAEDYSKAIFWYELATTIKKPEESWGSVVNDCYGYIPCMELCACYFKSGNLAEAIRYNKKAGEYKPDDKLVLHNQKYFETLLGSVVSKN
ncbi:glycosyltransferase [Dehalobacter restrictus]|uniref:Glycosyltransferase n=1 Tax=Dehalobacter restrictus TaxID=55583 RepID=A0A857DKD3_9FIRM|nr:glycosyltransferase [Dehalobacter restrictus]QHA00909.1 glycosyltransferase [Dehalobacter restrictus]